MPVRLKFDPAPAPPSDAVGRIPELDGLRGLAAMGIVLFHANPKRLPCGWAAVDLFFVLSGYLITAIILRHGSRPGFLRSFYIRRGLRIWPIYYLTLAAFVLLNPWLAAPQNFAALPYDLTYTQNVAAHWFGPTPVFSRYLRHTWTLAIEEQFYLIWPLLVLAVGRRGVMPLSLAVVAASVLARSRGVPLMALGARADGLALGGLLASLLDATGSIERRNRLRAGFLATLAVGASVLIALSATTGLNLPMGPPPRPGLALLAINLVWFGLIGRVVTGSGGSGLGSRALRRPGLGAVGRISYGLYLYHLPILLLSGDIARSFGLRGQPFWREGPTLLLCGVVAAVSWRFVERPILSLKDRWAGYRAGPASTRNRPGQVESDTLSHASRSAPVTTNPT